MNALDKISRHAHWFLRLAIASVFLYHGLAKFPNLEHLAKMMQMPIFIVALLATMETLGALLILAGGFLKGLVTRLGAFILTPVMMGAIFMVHWPVWDNFVRTESHPMGGMEFQVTLVLILLYFIAKGDKVND